MKISPSEMRVIRDIYRTKITYSGPPAPRGSHQAPPALVITPTKRPGATTDARHVTQRPEAPPPDMPSSQSADVYQHTIRCRRAVRLSLARPRHPHHFVATHRPTPP